MKLLNLSIAGFILGIWAVSFVVEAASNHYYKFPQSETSQLMQKILLSENKKNFVYSPIFVDIIVSMVYEAAEIESATQYELVPLLPNNFRNSSRYTTLLSNIKKDPLQKINFGTRIFSRNTNSIISSNVQYIRSRFDTEIEDLNSKSVSDINKWVKNVTKGNLKRISIEEELSKVNTIFLNVLFFEGIFSQSLYHTFEAYFYVKNRKRVEVWYMWKLDKFLYYEDEDLEIVQRRFKEEKYNMTILLPKSGRLEDLINKIDQPQIAKWQSKMMWKDIQVSLPRFSFSSQINIKSILKSIGKTSLFSDNHQFPMLGDSTRLSQITQKIGISIDEQTDDTDYILPDFEGSSTTFVADRPFLFLIQKNDADEIICAGKVINPSIETK